MVRCLGLTKDTHMIDLLSTEMFLAAATMNIFNVTRGQSNLAVTTSVELHTLHAQNSVDVAVPEIGSREI